MASNILLRILGDSGDAEKSISGVAAGVAALDRQDANVNVDVDAGAAQGQLALFAAEVEALDGKQVDVSVDVDRSAFAALAGLSAGLKSAAQAAGGGGGGGGGLGIAIRSIDFGPLSVGSSGASAAVLGLAAAIGVTLVGALAALGASLAGAAAGIGALAAGFAAVLGPAVAVAIGVGMSFAKVLAVLKAEDQARLQQSQQTAAGDQQATAAMDRRKTAAQALADAEVRASHARAQALREMADAAEAARDAELGLERAHLSSDQAALGVRQATLDLRQFREETKTAGVDLNDLFQKFTDVDVQFNTGALSAALAGAAGGSVGQEQQLKLEQLILNVRDAKLREKEATDGVSDATTALTRAQQADAAFKTKGIQASDQYAAALRGVRDAQRQVAVAARDARTPAAIAKVSALTGQLTDQQRRLLDVVRRLRSILHDTFGPAVAGVLDGIVAGLDRVARVVPSLRGAFGTLVATLTRPDMLAAFRQFTLAASRLAGPAAAALSSLFTVLANIARAAMPFLTAGFDAVAGFLGRLAGASGSATGLSIIIGGLVGHLKTWLSVGAAVARVFLAFFSAAAPQGREFAAAIARAANRLADWMNSAQGREEIRNFLKVAVPLALALGGLFFRIVVALARLGEIAAPILTPILTTMSTLVRVITVLLGKLTALSQGFGVVLEAIHSVMRRAIEFLGGLYGKFFDLGANLIKGLVDGIKHMAGAAVDAVKGLGGKIIGGVTGIFDSHSPSRVFFGIGEDVSRGLQLGLESMTGRVAVAATAALSTPVLAASPADARPAGARTATAGPEQVVNVDRVELSAPGNSAIDPLAGAVKFADLLRSRRRF